MSSSSENSILDILPDPLKDWVQAQVDAGAYDSADDYVRAVLQYEKNYQDKIEALRAALIEGEKSGVSKRSMDEIRAEARTRAKAEFGHG